jgi:hypothetical protein
MEVKVLCPCGTKFAFDVEPVDGQMPEPVACPACGADSTAAANAVIQQALASVVPARVATSPPVRIGAPSLPGTVPPGPAPVESAGDAEAAVTRCAKHPREVAAAECTVCGKPICQLCLDQFGLLCSVYCKQQAEQRNLVVPSFTGRRMRERAREHRQQNRFVLAVGLTVLAVIGSWAWYTFHASQPRLAFRLEASKSQPFVHAQWFRDTQLLSATRTRISLHTAGGREVWSTMLKPEENLLGPETGVLIRVTGDTFWAAQTGRVAQYDLATGQRKRDVALPPDLSEVLWDTGGLTVVASPARGPVTLTRVDLKAGQTQTETVRAATPAPATVAAQVRPRIDDEDDERDFSAVLSQRSEFTASGGGVVQLSSRLLQAHLVEAGDPNRPDAFSALDKETLRAGDSMPAAMAFARGSARLRVHDFGRYAVTLRRFFAGAWEWTGDVIGKPAFFSLTTVDVLVSGTNVAAFSRGGQKLWDARLNYPVLPDILRDADRFPDGPCREIGSRLYVFDLGVLTALDLKTGAVHWRLPAVGIEQVEADATGALYVAATTAGPEAIALDESLAANPNVQPLLLKVEPGSGKILWQRDRLAQRAFPSGKLLYGTRRQMPGRDLVSLATGDDTIHFRVRRLKPTNGEELWAYHQPRPPKHLEISGRRLLLQYPDEIQVVKFFSF